MAYMSVRQGSPTAGSYTLSSYPHDQVDVACSKCGKTARLSKASLIETYGREITLPDLRAHLAKEAGCTRYGKMHDPCGISYPRLAP